MRPDFPSSSPTFSGPKPSWYWKLDDASSGAATTVVASDGVEATVNGAASNANWTTDTIGGVAGINVLQMLGTAFGGMEVNPVVGGVGSSAFTVQVWMKPGGSVAVNDIVWTLHQAFPVFVEATFQALNIVRYNPTGGTPLDSTVPATSGTWYHAVCVVNGIEAIWYLNTEGTPFAATGGGIVTSRTPTDTTFNFFGMPSGLPGFEPDLLASEIAIWKSALSAADVESAFNEGTPISLV